MVRSPHPSSYRDRSGFVFVRGKSVFRQVNKTYMAEYRQLMDSGLYEQLVKRSWLIPHREVTMSAAGNAVIRPQRVPFISYPYEWCLGQWKEAALTTLAIQLLALQFGMTLKDATPFNIQFVAGKSVLIDTLSFARYQEGQPWIPYRQFCESFLAPMALMSTQELDLGRLLVLYPDGISLPKVSKLLPRKTWLNPGLFAHLHLHAQGQVRFMKATPKKKKMFLSKTSLIGLIVSLQKTVESLTLPKQHGQWLKYERENSYGVEAYEYKKTIVAQFLGKKHYKMIWDLGANTGVFSRLAAEASDLVVALDREPGVVEACNKTIPEKQKLKILPLVMDLVNPSPGLGWNNAERSTLVDRGPADVVLALALVHHLAIGENLPFEHIASYFQKISKNLIVEFVPKDDDQVQSLLAFRDDIFADYNQQNFEKQFKQFFRIREVRKILGTKRTLYLMSI